jgi:ATP-dependent Clp protease adapter protein ClpS
MGSADTSDGTPTLYCPLCGTNRLCDECVENCMAAVTDNDDSSSPKPTFSQNLDQSLQRAIAVAQERRHQYATDGHLLLALTDDPDAAAVLRAGGVDLERLRQSVSVSLSAPEESRLANGTAPRTSSSFQIIIQGAVIHVQSIGRDGLVTGAHVLVQMFSDTRAAEFLREQGMTRYDATRYISHGIAKGDRAAHERAGGTGPRITTDKPAGLLARVQLLNDDYTPMEFVVHVLERVFDVDQDDATRIMLHIHREGVGTCGPYPYDAADAKVTEVLDLARKHQHPLHCVLERSSSA